MRLDLAGGWTDVPPFSSEVGGAVLNVAITRYVQVSVQRRADRNVRLISSDYQHTLEGEPETTLAYNGDLDLLKAAVRAVGIHHVDLTVSSDTPPGGGLGSSGAVGVALLGALNALQPAPWPRHELADRAFRMETEDVGIPGGRQDQYAALNGGFQFIEFNDPAARSTRLDVPREVIQALRERLVLCYTGRSRVSGNIIATVMGNYRRGEAATTYALRRLKAIATAMRDALLLGDLDAFGRLLAENWECQKMLDASVTNPQIDSLFELATRNGAAGGKALGAGGGGCVLFYAPSDTTRLRQALSRAGLTLIDFDFDFEGLRVSYV